MGEWRSQDGKSRTGHWQEPQESLLRLEGPSSQALVGDRSQELTRGRDGLGPGQTGKDEGLRAREEGSSPGTVLLATRPELSELGHEPWR